MLCLCILANNVQVIAFSSTYDGSKEKESGYKLPPTAPINIQKGTTHISWFLEFVTYGKREKGQITGPVIIYNHNRK